MIRGIILLILSCVVLTLSTTQCHFCDGTPQPAYEQVLDYYPTSTIERVRPNDCSDLQEFYERVSVPENGFIKETSTSLLSGLLEEVTDVLESAVDLVQGLLDALLGFRHERGIIDGILDGVLGDILRVSPGCRHPLCAATLVEKIEQVSIRQSQLERDAQYLEGSYGAAQTRQELVTGEKAILDKFMTVSRNLDTRERKCNGRSGGLLGVVGGLLNPSCGRGFLVDTVLGLVATVLDLVRDLLNALGIDIENFYLALNLSLENLIELELVADLFESVTSQDRFGNDFRNEFIHPVIQQLENSHCLPQNEIYRRFVDIMGNEETRNHYYHLSQVPVGRGYTFDDFQMTCRNSKGIDICLDLDILGVLSVDLDLDLDISCELSFLIDLDLDVNLGQTIPLGVDNLLESLRLVTQGLTGSNQVQTNLVNLDVALGLAVASLDLKLGLGQRLCNPLLDLNLAIDIGSILSGVTGQAQRHITECNSFNTVEKITEEIQIVDNKISECVVQQPETNEEIDTLITNTNDMLTTQETAEEEYQEEYWNEWHNEPDSNDVDVIEQAHDTVEVLTEKTNAVHEQYRCTLEQMRTAIDTTEVRIQTSRREYLEARLQLLQNPTDTALIEICAAAEVRLTDLLNECIFLRDYFAQISADISLRLGALGGLLDVCVDLQARVSLLEGGLLNLVEDIRLHLSVDLNLLNFNQQLTSILHGLRPTISTVECLVNDVLGLPLGLLGMDCRVQDDCNDCESYEQTRHIHHQLLRPAAAVCGQNPNVQVTDDVPTKRSAAANQFDYRVTYANEKAPRTTTVDRATEETGMTAETKDETATTSSASSLVVSFLILFLSVLCFF